MTPRRLIRTVAALGAAAALASVVLLAQGPPVNPAAAGAAKPGAISAGMRRLTEQQYRNAIADIFGEEIQVAGRMEPIARLPHELQVDGVSRIGVSPALRMP